ncbi:hypothetical protein CHCC20441_0234 [Bacillus licheniformis]|uniref:Uncharacterized protein n=1 Tax=Bacillus licheniformis TaxID=1402 RepID=A0A8B5YC97_BACLI|nr:hypothetical protein B4092_0402 [Bacillus licheniformis]TWN08633.1 hypothetical protein CHCC14564_2365 [Bacillus licheniformis LMG 17339]KYC79623.1 hypothetical protein B4091_0596 [Bacillus licheniformis]KYC94188.1 hypothetical protein B4164_0531 [Bacillus licheniformis]OLF92427.1 hypothetical protein B4094_2434 [Bacillus licheniformis]
MRKDVFFLKKTSLHLFYPEKYRKGRRRKLSRQNAGLRKSMMRNKKRANHI